MKVWLRLLIGSVLGISIGLIIPSSNIELTANLAWLSNLAVQIGRYVLVPILVFSLTVSVYELRQDRQFWKLILKTVPVIVLCSIFVITVGLISVSLFTPGRIPVLNINQTEIISLNTGDNILSIFPSNMFYAIAGDGSFLLPACVFAFFMGIGFSYDRNYTKPVISLFDSLSRIFFYISRAFSEILGLVIIIVSAYWAVQFSSVMQAEIYGDMIFFLAILSIVLGCIILPLFLYLIKPSTNPWKVLFGSISQGLAGFFSGDINFTMPVIFRSIKEDLGVRRRANSVTVTLFSLFGRAGSATVAAVSLIVIINSYSSLDISLSSVIAIGFNAFLLSFLLSSHPGNGAFVALAVLCLDYGQGFESGYLILRPIAFYLIAIGTFLDVMICSLASYGIARSGGFQED